MLLLICTYINKLIEEGFEQLISNSNTESSNNIDIDKLIEENANNSNNVNPNNSIHGISSSSYQTQESTSILINQEEIQLEDTLQYLIKKAII
jgi:hypothetical protein